MIGGRALKRTCFDECFVQHSKMRMFVYLVSEAIFVLISAFKFLELGYSGVGA